MIDYVKKSGGQFTGKIYDAHGNEIDGTGVFKTIIVEKITMGPTGIDGAKTTSIRGYAEEGGDGNAAIFQGKQSMDDDFPYVETIVQNRSETGTADIIAEPDTGILQIESPNYVDFGINGSEYDGNEMGWGYTAPLDGYTFCEGGSLALGTTTEGKKLQLFAGGTEGSDVKMTISEGGVQFGFNDTLTTGGPTVYTTPVLDMAATPKKTIDPSARKLYFPDGTTVAVDYSVQGVTTIAGIPMQMSVTSDGSGIKLSGDSATPGNSKYYGTNAGGARGFYDLPTGGAGSSWLEVQVFS